jgi:hypothetical protein
LLFAGLLYNWLRRPTRLLLAKLDAQDNGVVADRGTA